MRRPKTFDEAVAILRSLPPGTERRFYALKDGFEAREVPKHGLGLFPVEVATGKVCAFRGQWTPAGDLLVCERCFEDGT